MTDTHSNATNQAVHKPRLAILKQTIEGGLGPGCWVAILSALGVVAGLVIGILSWLDHEDEMAMNGWIICAISLGGVILGIIIFLIMNRTQPAEQARTLDGLCVDKSQLTTGRFKVAFDRFSLNVQKDPPGVVAFEVEEVEQTISSEEGGFKLAIGIAVNEGGGGSVTGNEFRFITYALSQNEKPLWKTDLRESPGFVWILSGDRVIQPPLDRVKKRRLMAAFEDIHQTLTSVSSPRFDVNVSFLMPGANIVAWTFAFGLVGGATEAFCNWHANHAVRKLFEGDSQDVTKEDETIFDIMKNSGWTFRLIQ